jgi:hypothetical protein
MLPIKSPSYDGKPRTDPTLLESYVGNSLNFDRGVENSHTHGGVACHTDYRLYDGILRSLFNNRMSVAKIKYQSSNPDLTKKSAYCPENLRLIDRNTKPRTEIQNRTTEVQLLQHKFERYVPTTSIPFLLQDSKSKFI